MAKKHSIEHLYEKQFKTYPFTGHWLAVMDQPEQAGVWLIYGNEKNGKTWLALMLANMLSNFSHVDYISGEEGLGPNFQKSCKRAGLEPNNKRIRLMAYLSLEELYERLRKRQSANVVFIDNITIYADELRYGNFRKLLLDFPNKLFIFLAHEEAKQPYTSTAKLCKKLAQIIIRVEGLKGIVSGRCPGGEIIIDEAKSALYHGATIENP